MRRKLKQKRRIFEIKEIRKRRNFEADAERGDAKSSINVMIYFLKKMTMSYSLELHHVY